MYSNSNTTSTSAPKLFTGLTSFSVLGVNPTKEDIEGYLGREYKLNVNYDVVELGNREVRPIEIWLQDYGKNMTATPIRFYISNADDVAQTGAIKFVNQKGAFTYAKSEEALTSNERMAWFTSSTFRVAKVGENELFTFLQRLMRYDSRPADADFLGDNEKNGVTIEKLFNNDLTGLRKVLSWCTENNNHVVAIAAVRSTSKIVDGDTKVYYNQTLCNNPNFFFQTSTGDVSSRAVTVVNEALEKGDRISKFMFTVEFQPFDKEKCVNSVPAETASTSTSYNPSNLL